MTGGGADVTGASAALDDEFFQPLKPETVLLKDNQTVATLYPIANPDQQLAPRLLEFLCEEFNQEIFEGQTYPMETPFELDNFKHYWFGSFGAVFLLGSHLPADDDPTIDWGQFCLGTFYVKPNYPGRCSHVCNAGFVVNTAIRGKGIGRAMGELYLKWAPRLGYTYSIFNLVFKTNEASIKIWDALGFDRVGLVKGAGRLKGFEKPVDAIIYGKDLI
jgi:RimJ/RimL family protein N-acetyltransferase